jgi:putative membrane protein
VTGEGEPGAELGAEWAPKGGPEVPGPDAPARLPWAAVALEARASILALVGILFFLGPFTAPLLGIFGLFLAVRVVQIRLLRWWVDEEAFVVERGLLFRSRRVIPRARVQAVDLERGILHRLLGVSEVRVEALGGMETEGRLPGIPAAVAERLRSELLGGRGAGEERAPEGAAEGGVPVPEAPPRVQLGGAEVIVAGLTESRIGAGIAVVGVGFESIRQGAFSGWFGEPESWAPLMEALPWVAILVLFGVLVLLFSLALSFVLTVLGYWGFTLQVRDRVLEVERGLLTQHRDTVPMERIQAVRVEENPFRRLMGLAKVRAVVAGRAGTSQGEGTNVLLPVAPRAEAFALAAEMAGLARPDAAPGVPELTPMSSAARRRRWVRAALLGGGVFALGLLGPGGWGAALLWSLGAALLALPFAEGAWRGLGWVHPRDHLPVREGILTRTTTFVPLVRLQSVEVTQNPFQRRLGLATLTLPVARPLLEADPRALDLERGVAEGLRARILGHGAGGPEPSQKTGETGRRGVVPRPRVLDV